MRYFVYFCINISYGVQMATKFMIANMTPESMARVNQILKSISWLVKQTPLTFLLGTSYNVFDTMTAYSVDDNEGFGLSL